MGDDFERMARRLGYHSPFFSEEDRNTLAEVTDKQRELQNKVLEALQYGVEEVDIFKLFEGRPIEEVLTIASATTSIMLSSFCTGGCRECALDAKPYSKKNKKIFEINKLLEFLQMFPLGGSIGDLMIYDASDPLDYPYIFQLLQYLDNCDNYFKVKLLTSCPPGREELLRELLSIEFRRVEIGVSGLASNQDRHQENGVFEMIRDDAEMQFYGLGSRYKPISQLPIGRARAKGYLAAGFWCGDMTMINPVDGPCIAEYHISSDLHPYERKVTSIDEKRRVYLHNPFFALKSKMPFDQGTIYEPHTSYLDLDSGELICETALRHLAAYMYHFVQALIDFNPFSEGFIYNFQKIHKAFKEKKFVIPDDEKEVEFYKNLIKEILVGFEELKKRGYAPIDFNAQRDLPRYYQLIAYIKEVLFKYLGEFLE